MKSIKQLPYITVEQVSRYRSESLAIENERDMLLEALRNLSGDVQSLIDSSEGVSGLHLNGDFAPWDELTKGGRFEDWLVRLADAQAIIKQVESDG